MTKKGRDGLGGTYLGFWRNVGVFGWRGSRSRASRHLPLKREDEEGLKTTNMTLKQLCQLHFSSLRL